MEKKYNFEDLVNIIEVLRSDHGCPWDREQTHDSLKQCMIEEAYEVVDGITQYTDTGDDENLCEELGDVLLQVLMHSQIAKEDKRFTLDDVIQGISEKMVRRHPHVFGNVTADTTEQVLQNWDEIKKEEKQEELLSDSLKRIPKAMPALIKTQKVQKKALKNGVGMEDFQETIKRINWMLEKLEKARNCAKHDDLEENYEELLFYVVNLSSILKLNAENSLTNATDKFINRFVDVERSAIIRGKRPTNWSDEELDTLWGRIENHNI